MRIFSSILIAILVSTSCLAHQSNISTSFLTTTSNGMHVLQITSSLGAFEGEIDFIYTKDAYKTPEEFRALVIKHFKERVLFIVNGHDTLHFGTPRVILGHETKLVVEVLDIPNAITSVYFKNTMFKDIHQNQMAMMLSSSGFPKNQVELNNANNHHVLLSLVDGDWINQEIKNATPFYKRTGLILAVIAALTIVILAGVIWKRN